MSESARLYQVNEIFLSVQGEGVRAGTLNVFVRLAKCNLRCSVEPGKRSPGGFDCDTEFESGRLMPASEVAATCVALWPTGIETRLPGDPWVILTGGEPSLQLDAELSAALRTRGFRIAIETNGSVELPKSAGLTEAALVRACAGTVEEALTVYDLVDWITVSPKVAEHAIRQRWAHEVKYVRGAGQAVPETVVRALHYLVSPAFNGLELDRAALDTCLAIVRVHPRWRLSVQQHKAWRVR